jgi:hypothetical protein
MPSINGIDINATTLGNAYKRYYPNEYNDVVNNKLIFYTLLFGIRTSTCDTSLPDDLIGAIRMNYFANMEVVVSDASTDPSPKNLKTLFDAEARAKGGTAWVKEGQHLYRYYGTNHPTYKPLPSFYPIKPMTVYRWSPSQQDIQNWEKNKVPLSKRFEEAKRNGQAKISTSNDTMIHKTWSSDKLWADSAGCQVLRDKTVLKTLGDWASEHLKKKYTDIFTYTLFSAEEFTLAQYPQKRAASSSSSNDRLTIANNLKNKWQSNKGLSFIANQKTQIGLYYYDSYKRTETKKDIEVIEANKVIEKGSNVKSIVIDSAGFIKLYLKSSRQFFTTINLITISPYALKYS